ncbi:MAG: hydratase [Clostridiales bacterium]|jgi:aconitate hydratase|nr:hydratase [Clostridiales bacterium]
MTKLYEGGVYFLDGEIFEAQNSAAGFYLGKCGKKLPEKAELKKNTIAHGILEKHNISGDGENLKLKFDAMASHDITYVGIIQTARASGLTEFPVPYVLTNCHNSLCAVGGTINEDDHVFGLSAAQKYGGIYVPAHFAVIHQYMREMMAGCGKMILGSDSHTRYGALGTMAIGEGGGELAKQLLKKTYDVAKPQVVGVYLAGKPKSGVGPMDVALTIIKEVFANGFVKNAVMEFIGSGISNLSVDFRNGIDVMTTETACLSSIWQTDAAVEAYYAAHGRKEDYAEIKQPEAAYYDRFIYVNLSEIKPMIAMPFHPSNVYAVEDVIKNPFDILKEVENSANEQLENPKLALKLTGKIHNGALFADQAVIAGCAGGTFENICNSADILRGKKTGSGEFSLSVYPSSQPVNMKLAENGVAYSLMQSGASMRSAFCGPCFGAGDVPFNGALSLRHTTRNFPNREGSKPGSGQIASVALMDARSISATAANGGKLTSAEGLDVKYTDYEYTFNKEIYQNRVYFGYNKAKAQAELKIGPNIADWPQMPALTENLLLKTAAFITDAVTTTDELIPSGETSSYRSNPIALAQFTLSRKDPEYVNRAKEIQEEENKRVSGSSDFDSQLVNVFNLLTDKFNASAENTGIGSVIYAEKPGDGSAREQAASCQKVLGGWANIAKEYATKRYRSNLINWGMLPFVIKETPQFSLGDYIFIPHIKDAVTENNKPIEAYIIKGGEKAESGGNISENGGQNTGNISESDEAITAIPFNLYLAELTEDEKKIILAGCLINYYK